MDLRYIKEEVQKRVDYQNKFEIPFLNKQIQKHKNNNEIEYKIYLKRKDITNENLKKCEDIIKLIKDIRSNSLTNEELKAIVG